jgi:hypothetical protein
MAKKPANDPRPWTTEDDWYVCPCGSPSFGLKRNPKTGWLHILCLKCDMDNSSALLT